MVLSLLLSVAFTTNVTISNVWPRHNTTGSIIDAHDGTYNRWTPDGPWYYYAMVRACALRGPLAAIYIFYSSPFLHCRTTTPPPHTGVWERVQARSRHVQWPLRLRLLVDRRMEEP